MRPYIRVWFDRGEVVVEGRAGGQLVGTRFDGATRTFRARASDYASLVAQADELGLLVDDQVAPQLSGPGEGPRPLELSGLGRELLLSWQSCGGRGAVLAPPSTRARLALAAATSDDGRAAVVCTDMHTFGRYRALLDAHARRGAGPRAAALFSLDDAERAMAHDGDRFSLLVIDGEAPLPRGSRALEASAAPSRLVLAPRRSAAAAPVVAEARVDRGPLAPVRVARLAAPLDLVERRDYEAASRAASQGAKGADERRRALAALCSCKRAALRRLLVSAPPRSRVVIVTALPPPWFCASARTIVEAAASDLSPSARRPLLELLARGQITSAQLRDDLGVDGDLDGAALVILLGGAPAPRSLPAASLRRVAPRGAVVELFAPDTHECPEHDPHG